MKNKILTFLMVIGMVGVLVGCSKLTRATLTEGTYKVSTTDIQGEVKTDDGKFLFDYTFKKPQLENKEEVKFVQDDIDKIYNDYLEDIQSDSEFSFKSYCLSSYEYMSFIDSEAFECAVNYEVKKNANGIFSFLIEEYEYSGGAHGSTEYIAKNYNLSTQKNLELKDIFKGKYEEKLLELITIEVEKLRNDKFPVAIFNNYSELIGVALDNNSFYFEGDNIVFLYNQYEIAPYSEGQIMISIPLSELNEFLKDDFLK